MPDVDERVDRLEILFASFLEESQKASREHRELIRKLEVMAQEDRERFFKHQCETAERQEDFMTKLDRIQAETAQRQEDFMAKLDRVQTETAQRHEECMAKFDQVEAEAARRHADYMAESTRDRKEWKKKLAEISDSVGTFVEDMVAPQWRADCRAVIRWRSGSAPFVACYPG